MIIISCGDVDCVTFLGMLYILGFLVGVLHVLIFASFRGFRFHVDKYYHVTTFGIKTQSTKNLYNYATSSL